MALNAQSQHVHYVVKGSGPPVLLVHGLAASLHDWADMLPDLADNGYRAYALDLLGHGLSEKPHDPVKYQSEGLLAHLQGWIDALALDEPVVFIGHSLGGYLSLSYTLRSPERVRGLVLIDPYYSPRQLSPLIRLVDNRPRLGEKAMRLTPAWFIHAALGWDPVSMAHFSPEARRQIAADYKRASPKIVHITGSLPDLTAEMPKVSVPVKVIWGERDLTLKTQSFPRLVEALPHASGCVIAGCGHQPHIGKPELVNHLVLDFLAGLSKS
jgi:pimeloyl-ACP methyl ester carboxylesterase